MTTQRSMKELRFGAVYGAPPFFCPDVDQMGYWPPSDLDLPLDLIKKIQLWDGEYQRTFCEEYPPDSKFASEAELKAHNRRGEELAKELRQLFGETVLVRFLPISD